MRYPVVIKAQRFDDNNVASQVVLIQDESQKFKWIDMDKGFSYNPTYDTPQEAIEALDKKTNGRYYLVGSYDAYLKAYPFLGAETQIAEKNFYKNGN